MNALRSFSGVFLLAVLLGLPPVFAAETAPNRELEGILQKIESRHYRWIGLRADVLLFFAKTGDPNAMCGGELLYQRLDERMFLTCVDAQQQLMFIFRMFDRRFDLYLPSQNTVYHGSIFDMEDSPDIESHLKARDLYRALKPMAVDPRRAKVERTNDAITSLDVYGRNEDEGKLVRKLYLTPEGDVRGELFYDSKGRPMTEIQRYDFREIKGQAGSYDSIIFPKKITITSPETKKGSAIFFNRVKALDTVDPLEFMLRFPSKTKEVYLDERDPRFASKSKETAVTQPPVQQQPEVYLATPIPNASRPKSKETAPKSKPREKKSKKDLPPAPREEKTEPKSEKPSGSPAPAAEPVATVVSEPAEADLVVEDRAPAVPLSTADAQTTLDPSVDPMTEMEKQ